MRRTREEALITRKTLLDAGLRVFSRKGYSDTRLEDIAEEAGVTRGALYHYFDGKVDLFEALLAERFAPANQHLKNIMNEGGDSLTLLRRLLVQSLCLLEEDEDYCLVQELTLYKTAYVPELENGFRQKIENMHDLTRFITEVLRQGIQNGEIRADVVPEQAALMIMGFINGIISMWLMDRAHFSLSREAEGMVNYLLRGIQNKEV